MSGNFEPIRLRKWLRKRLPHVRDFDHPAFDKMADALMDSLAAAGGPDKNFEKYVALLKALSMMTAAMSINEDLETVFDICNSVGVEMYSQVSSFRKAAEADLKKAR